MILSFFQFFSSIVELLNQLLEYKHQAESPVALWEDYELRGFVPVLNCHSSLDFFTENEENFRTRNDFRVLRVLQAAIKIANRSADSNHQSWIFYDFRGKFYTKESQLQEEEEEEEDIVFKPNDTQNRNFDESLRCASSRLIAQNRALINSLTTSPAHAGPPSLSAWVFNDNMHPAPSAPLIPEDANWCKLSSYIEALPPLPPWPRILGNRKNLHFTNNKGSLQFQEGSYRNHGLNSVPAVYTESTVSMQPMPPFANGLYHQMGYETQLNVGENQQQLLQYRQKQYYWEH